MIEIKGLVELTIVTLVIKLIVSQWYPPIQRSIQGIIAITLGTGIGIFMNPTKEGLITGIIGSGLAFYGAELVDAFKDVSKDASELPINNKNRTLK